MLRAMVSYATKGDRSDPLKTRMVGGETTRAAPLVAAGCAAPALPRHDDRRNHNRHPSRAPSLQAPTPRTMLMLHGNAMHAVHSSYGLRQ